MNMTKFGHLFSFCAIRGYGYSSRARPVALVYGGSCLSRKEHSDCTGPLITRHSSLITLVYLLSWFFYLGVLCGSGAYDHGTSTGKGKLQVDLTWNPFDIFKFGQSYVVIGYGFTDKLDIHAYYAHGADDIDTYYYGIYYQFLGNKIMDLATAIGIRNYWKARTKHLFFPQLLYNIKLGSGYSIGGSLVNIQTIDKNRTNRLKVTFDIALFIPMKSFLTIPEFINDLNLAIGFFRPSTYNPNYPALLPTYSIDIKINWQKQ